MKRLVLLPACVSTGILSSSKASSQLAAIPLFYFQSYMGRCLDYGAPPQVVGSPVFIYGCNQTAAQQVGVEEIPTLGAHQVRLHAGSLCIGVASPPPKQRSALTLQACGGPAAQMFALDGDSILLDSNLVGQTTMPERPWPLISSPEGIVYNPPSSQGIKGRHWHSTTTSITCGAKS